VDGSAFLLPIFSKEPAFDIFQFDCKEAERMHQGTFFIPISATHSESDLDIITSAVQKACQVK